jgi:hypothetical protein
VPPTSGAIAQQTTFAPAVAYCSTLSLGGHSDWRLPSEVELLSLFDYGISSSVPGINSAAFPGAAQGGAFWSSTPVAGSSSAWSVAFFGGFTSTADITTGMSSIRCVR